MEKLNNPTNPFQVSEISLYYKTKIKTSERPQIHRSQDAFKILYSQWDLNKIDIQEQFKILLLNRANRVLGICEVASGGHSGTLADPKLIFALALKGLATGVILAHNHPSGNLKPSQQDLKMTERLKSAGELLDITILDHLILSPEECYLSLADECLM